MTSRIGYNKLFEVNASFYSQRLDKSSSRSNYSNVIEKGM